MTVQGPARVQVSHHQYVLLDTDAEEPDQDIDDRLAGNGLVYTNQASTYATVLTGTSYGDVDVVFDVIAGEPPLNCEGWDEVVEVSLCFPSEGPLVGDPLSEDLVEVPLLGEEGEYQWWRFRIHARGRDAASETGDIHAEEGDTVLEQHLVQIWAAPQAPETRHRLTDEVGRRRRTASPEEYEAAKAAEAAHAEMPPTPPEEMPMAPKRAELHTRTPDTPD
ncbi:hypothetical protein OG520_44310 (plasmid) [Streptomyces sp. NBC_00984]|uniref:hypothetical protein n=1 Tax=Streptomyces sp. NBC_00984 TaxID=2903700 RepID=UPI002F90A657|nr:hypothetical protein OG520_44310 [Streptomyces sp. NBC_00984]